MAPATLLYKSLIILRSNEQPENVEFVTIFGKRMQGRDEINAGHKVVFETLLTGTHLTVSGVDVMPLSGATNVQDSAPPGVPR